MLDREDVQSLIFSEHASHPASCALLLSFEGGRPNRWLRHCLPQVSSGALFERREPYQLNLALTCHGLRRLGLPASTLGQLSREFRQGMAHPERSALLGDMGDEAPATWELGGCDAATLDGVLLLYAYNTEALEGKLGTLRAALLRFGIAVEELATFLPADSREHFGFRLGVPAPRLRGDRQRGGPRIARGEVLLGHRDHWGEITPVPTAPWRRTWTRELPPPSGGPGSPLRWGLNGTYLVIRKLVQRHEVVPSVTGRPARACQTACGAGPFDPAAHRLLRRARLLPAPGAHGSLGARGLLFMALNANIAQQFELIASTSWAVNTGIHLPDEPHPALVPSSVRLRGGAYTFLPSLRALEYLAELRRDQP